MNYEKMWNELKEKVNNMIDDNEDLAWNLILQGFKELIEEIEKVN